MTLYEWLKFGHVLGAAIWVGAGVYGTVVGFRAVTASRRDRLAVINALESAGALFGISGALVVGLGVWMVIDSPALGFGEPWIVVAYVGLALSGALQGAVMAPQTKLLKAELEADDPAADGRMQRIMRFAWLDPAILIVVIWAMVTKPGA
jgi:uncharacterized membrane protein